MFWISLFIAALSATGMFAYPESGKAFLIFVILLAVSSVFTVVFLKRLVRFGRSPLAAILKKLSARISKAAAAVFRRSSKKRAVRTREKTYLTGSDQHSFGDGGREKKRRRAEKPRWNRLKSNGERVRFLYRYVIIGKMKKGRKISPCETPVEQIGSIPLENAETDVALAYTEVRWNYRDDTVSDGDVKRLRSGLGLR